jgi:hypothetical protein
MRRRRAQISALLSVLLLALLVPTASAGVVRSDYTAFMFPAGWPNSGFACPGTFITDPIPACVLDPGTIRHPGPGRTTIRGMATMSIVLSTSDPSDSGYQLATLNANLDAADEGPAWGTYTSYTFANVALYSGTYNGKFENARLGGHFVGRGVGAQVGFHMTGDLLFVDAATGNVRGVVKQTGP